MDYFPLAGLSFFLIISIIHFSEDWKPELNFFERLVMATALISSTVFFQHDDINSIFYMLTNSHLKYLIIISFFNYIFYLLIFCLLIIILQILKILYYFKYCYYLDYCSYFKSFALFLCVIFAFIIV